LGPVIVPRRYPNIPRPVQAAPPASSCSRPDGLPMPSPSELGRGLPGTTQATTAAGVRPASVRVEARHLGPLAGSALSLAPSTGASPDAGTESTATPAAPAASPPPSKARITSVLKRCEGNVSEAARELGMHRTQLRRWLDRHGLEPRTFAPPGRAPADDD